MSAVWLRLFNTDRAMLALLPNKQSRSGMVEISQSFSESILFGKGDSCPMSAIAACLSESGQSAFLPIPDIHGRRITPPREPRFSETFGASATPISGHRYPRCLRPLAVIR